MRRVAVLLAVLALCVSALPAAAGPRSKAWKPRPATFDVVTQTDVRITMSDGVRLTADVHFPAKDGEPLQGRLPAILTQTPYNKNSGALAFYAEHLVTRGYIQVIADVRGTGGSEGTWDSFGTREQIDGAELVEWITEQAWSNGDVGLHGTSYGAINQLFTAARQPKGLKAIFPVVPMADSYRDIVGTGGQINTSFIPLWLGLVTSLGLLPPSYTGADPVGAVGALASHVGGAAAFQAKTVASATTGGDGAYDGPFSRQRSPIRVIDKVEVPTFIVGGWFDLFQRGEPLLYERLAANNVESRLLMGPWYHTNVGEGLPAKGVPTVEELELRWFDHYLMGKPDPGLKRDVAPVTYYRLGDETYHTTSSWPPPGTDGVAAFTDGQAAPGSPGGLTAKRPTGDPAANTVPWHPLAGTCTRSTAQWTATGAPTCTSDQRFNDYAGLSYDLPITADTAIAGPIAARLFVATQGRDAAMTVRLEDVAPDGSVVQLSQGWQVLSLRQVDQDHPIVLERDDLTLRPYHHYTRDAKLPVEAGEVYETWVEIFPTAALLAKGHTLRLSIQPSDTPHLSPPAPQAVDLLGGDLQIVSGKDFPSALHLPVQQ
jgi:hypothetical protein